MSTPVSKFAWYELMTTDTEAAGKFYASVVGWTPRDMGNAEMPYTTFNLGEVGVAGMMPMPAEAGPMPAWIGYIHVPDTDDYVKKVEAAGGKLHKGPIDVPGMLRFAVMTDAEGGPFMLFTGAPEMKPPADPPAFGSTGTVGWHELMANDHEKAFSFYSGLFGWSKGESHDMGPMGVYQIFNVDGVPVGGMMNKPPNIPSPFWNFYFQVDGIKAAVSRVEAAGGKVFHGPHQVPGGSWIIVGGDPQGASFCLVSATE